MVALAGGAAIAIAVWFARASPPEQLPVVTAQEGKSRGPSMCPWRDSERDLRTLFPASAPPLTYKTDTLALSRLRQRILDRLGPGGRIDDNSLYVHRVKSGSQTVGSVLVRRAAGPYGAIEVVTAIGSDRKVVGVRIQRQREPEKVAHFITSPAWLAAFTGKSASSPLTVGKDLTSTPPDAAPTAAIVASTVRSALIELDEADKVYLGGSSAHH
jgi:hypothetical protein